MKRPRLIKSDTQEHEYSEQVISTPLNDRERSLSRSLSEAEVESK
jgi:hypothetical protein